MNNTRIQLIVQKIKKVGNPYGAYPLENLLPDFNRDFLF